MENNQNSFIFYTEWAEYLEDMTFDEIGKLMSLILIYKRTGEVPEFSPSERDIKFVFKMIKNQLDRDAGKWEETKNARSEAGKRGASKRWKEESPAMAENSNAISENDKNSNAIVCHTLPSSEMAKIAVNVNDNVDVNVNESVNVNVQSNSDTHTHNSPQKNNKIPTLSEVSDYVRQKNYIQNPQQFYAYYSARDWIVSGSPVYDWQSLCDTWEWRENGKNNKPAPKIELGLPPLPSCKICGQKTMYQSGVCACPNVDHHNHFYELCDGKWKLYEKAEFDIHLPKRQI